MLNVTVYLEKARMLNKEAASMVQTISRDGMLQVLKNGTLIIINEKNKLCREDTRKYPCMMLKTKASCWEYS